MHDHIRQRLEAEARSGSQGYFTLRPRKHLVLDGDGADGTLARWRVPEDGVAVRPLAGVTELLQAARSRRR